MHRKRAASIAVVALVILAGCAGGGPAEPSAGTTTELPESGSGTEESADDERRTLFDAEPKSMDGVDDAEVKQETIRSMSEVESYRLNGTVERTLRLPADSIESNVTSEVAIDRQDRTLRIVENTTGHMQNVESHIRVVDGTLYQSYDAKHNDSDGEWERSSIDDPTVRELDTLARQTRLIENASVMVTNRTTIDGTEAYVVYADVDEAAYDAENDPMVGDQPLDVTEVTYRYHVATDTHRLLDAEGIVRGTVESGNETIELAEKYDITVTEYGSTVDVVPPADTAETTTANESDPTTEPATTTADTSSAEE